MLTYDCHGEPIRVYGLPMFYQTGEFHRLSADVGEAVPTLNWLRKVAAGGRVRFRTDAPQFTVEITYAPFAPQDISSLRGQTAATVYVNQRWSGDVMPENVTASDRPAVKEIANTTGAMADVTVFLPTGHPIRAVSLSFPDGAKVEAPTPYPNEGKPLVFYGSSITQGFHAGRPANTYVNLLSRWMNRDVVNLGFSGNARGEQEVARAIAAMDMSAFVLDFDHNCPDPDMLRERHEPFYRTVRAAHPDLPILMITRPDVDGRGNFPDRMRQVVRETYAHALAAGEPVWFLDGQELFGTEDRDLCTVDGCHPSDLGSYRMAKRIQTELRKMLDGGLRYCR